MAAPSSLCRLPSYLPDSTSAGGYGQNGIALVNFSIAQNAAVPEPATWAMMLIGFGGIGVSLRRRKRMVFAQAA